VALTGSVVVYIDGGPFARPDAGLSQLKAVFLPVGGLSSLTVFC